MGNSNLHRAKKEKNDEFYTLYEDVEKEMKFYDFTDRVVYCNCDDYKVSNFVKYFIQNFKTLGLKKLIAASYSSNGNGSVCVYNGETKETDTLKGDGDFRSEECSKYLLEADFVVTNPPFSLLREFIIFMFEKNKRFLVIGNMNAITYKEIFPYIKENRLWLGVSLNGTKCNFIVPDGYEGNNTYVKDDVRYAKINNTIWFTNIDILSES